ncbi:MAG TPA: helix-turn-helix transcriptional regulator [Lachnospiraceae bacterium]|nr:helix-turn-helix transcriptional regulator [Lachnospiraceae bacterium]
MSENAERNLRLFQELLTCAHNVYFWTYDSHLANTYTNCPDAAILNSFFLGNIEQTRLLLPLGGMNRPAVLEDSLDLLWIADYEKDTVGNLLYIHVIGPVFIEDFSEKALENVLHSMKIPASRWQPILRVLEALPVIPVTRFYEYGVMLHYCICGEKIAFSDLQYPESHNRTKSECASQSGSHGTWAMEQELLRLIEEGNPDYRKKSGRLVTGGNVANLGRGDSIRQVKNITIVFTALCTRAAIRGGLSPEVAYTLSDKYIIGIESCSTLSEAAEINDAMQEDFVNRVHQCKLEQYSVPIQNCCNYIQLHLGDRNSIPDLAKQAGYSENYLSRKFRKEMGITLTEYVTRQRIEAAKEMLISGTEEIQDICTRLGFGSQSYFGEVFRKYTKMSPSEYRAKWSENRKPR